MCSWPSSSSASNFSRTTLSKSFCRWRPLFLLFLFCYSYFYSVLLIFILFFSILLCFSYFYSVFLIFILFFLFSFCFSYFYSVFFIYLLFFHYFIFVICFIYFYFYFSRPSATIAHTRLWSLTSVLETQPPSRLWTISIEFRFLIF